ncbi:MAG: hypothetical protein WCL44_09010 [bacterium]
MRMFLVCCLAMVIPMFAPAGDGDKEIINSVALTGKALDAWKLVRPRAEGICAQLSSNPYSRHTVNAYAKAGINVHSTRYVLLGTATWDNVSTNNLGDYFVHFIARPQVAPNEKENRAADQPIVFRVTDVQGVLRVESGGLQ